MSGEKMLIDSLKFENIDQASLAQSWAAVSEFEAKLKTPGTNQDEVFRKRLSSARKLSAKIHFGDEETPFKTLGREVPESYIHS